MPVRYTALPTQDEANSRELADAFGSDNEDDGELAPLHNHRSPQIYNDNDDIEATAGLSNVPNSASVPGAYDFERDYDVPPPGSPPGPSSFALPNNFGNSNGLIPTSPVRTTFDRRPRPTFFRRIMGAVLPTHYSQLPTEDSAESSSSSSGPRRVIGGGSDNDGVFANVMAKPVPASTRMVQDEEGNVHMVPEDNQKEAPPSYAVAQADAAPAYWETTVHAPAIAGEGGDGSMLIDDLPSGSVWIFFLNLTISWFFQFVGFLLTFILHTSHAAKYGSRAGLGLTLIQYGFYSRSATAGGWGDDSNNNAGDGNGLVQIITTDPSDPPIPSSLLNGTGIVDPGAQQVLPGVNSRDWISFLLMTIGWFLLLSSTVSFWRVKRWETSIRSSTSSSTTTTSTARTQEVTPAPGSQFLTREQYENDLVMRRNLASVFGINFDEEEHEQNARDAVIANGGMFSWTAGTGRVHVDDNGHAVVIPRHEALEEARLARDLRAAGLL